MLAQTKNLCCNKHLLNLLKILNINQITDISQRLVTLKIWYFGNNNKHLLYKRAAIELYRIIFRSSIKIMKRKRHLKFPNLYNFHCIIVSKLIKCKSILKSHV